MYKLIIAMTTGFFILNACDSTSKEEVVKESELTSDVDFMQVGDSLSTLAQQELLKNVAAAIKKGGPSYAVDFCNIHASKLMDSISLAHNVKISRISMKYRNELNKPSDFESKLLERLENSTLKKDTLISSNGINNYYKPILIGMPTCLKCHGSEKEIDKETLNLLQSRYPKDLAKGYKLGDFRGAWKIEFEK